MNIHHGLVTWELINPIFLKTEMSNGVYSSKFNLDPSKHDMKWQLGFIPVENSFYWHEMEMQLILENSPESIRVRVSSRLFQQGSEISDCKELLCEIRSGAPLMKIHKVSVFDTENSFESLVKETINPWKWTVEMEIIYHEELTSSPNYATSTKRKMQVGKQLAKYAFGSKDSDLTLHYNDHKVIVHEALIEARCPKLLSQFCNVFGHVLMERDWTYEAFEYFVLFLYSGHADILLDKGTLPVGLKEIGQRIGNEDVAEMTEREDILCRTTFCKSAEHKFQYSFLSTDTSYHPKRRFKWPIFDGKEVSCSVIIDNFSLDISIQVPNSRNSTCVTLEAAFLNSKNEMEIKKKKLLTIKNTFKKFCCVTKEDLRAYRARNKGKITLLLKVSVSKNCCTSEKVGTDSFYQDALRDNPHEVYYDNLRTSVANLCIDLNRMMRSPIHKDFEFESSDGIKFKVHEFMLSAQFGELNYSIARPFLSPIPQIRDRSEIMKTFHSTVITEALKEIYAGDASFTEDNMYSLYTFAAVHYYKGLEESFKLSMLFLTGFDSCIKAFVISLEMRNDLDFGNKVIDKAIEMIRDTPLHFYRNLHDFRSLRSQKSVGPHLFSNSRAYGCLQRENPMLAKFFRDSVIRDVGQPRPRMSDAIYESIDLMLVTSPYKLIKDLFPSFELCI